MPRLWNDTIEAHRKDVSEAIMETTATLVFEDGLASVTMTRIAEETGIGRATLYKYFRDVETILRTWHERQVRRHLEQLVEARNTAGDDAHARLTAVLETYALIQHEHMKHHENQAGTTPGHPRHTHAGLQLDQGVGHSDVGAYLHRGQHVARAEEQLNALVVDLLAEAVKAGLVRSDVPPGELAEYCVGALAAASNLRSRLAVERLVKVTLDGLQP